MPITKDTVDHVAKLSRLEFNESEKEQFTQKLGAIIDYVSQLNRLDTENVAPLTHTLELSTPYREDQVRPALSVEEVLANAPDREGVFFRVPPVIE